MSKVVTSVSIDPRIVVAIHEKLDEINRSYSNFMEVAAMNLLWDMKDRPEMKIIPGKEVD